MKKFKKFLYIPLILVFLTVLLAASCSSLSKDNPVYDVTEAPEITASVTDTDIETSDDVEIVEKIVPPDFTVTDIDGNEIKLSEFTGKKPVIVNFWASWCEPCKSEMPDYELMYKQYGDQVEFIMINTLDNDTVDAAMKFINDNGFTFPVYFDTIDNNAAIVNGINSYPTSYFYGIDGYMAVAQRGALTAEYIQIGIDMILSDN